MLPPPPPDSKPPLPPKQPRKYRKGGWVSAADDEVRGLQGPDELDRSAALAAARHGSSCRAMCRALVVLVP